MSNVTGLLTKTKYKTIITVQKGVFLGVEVTGVNLSKPLTEEIIEEIKDAHANYGVIVFPNQFISSEDLQRFGRYFGKLSVHPFSTNTEGNPELIIFDNKEGNPPASTDVWHTDETFRECPPMGTILYSKIIPNYGGDTNFASMSAIYDGLSDRLQNFLSGLEAVHNLGPFQNLFPDTAEGRKNKYLAQEKYQSVTHPVIRVHSVTGRKILFVNPQFTTHIKGMAEDESRSILDMLFKKTPMHEYHYRHKWDENMLIFWDNQAIQHSALHDYYPQQRMMERVTINNDQPPIADAPAPDPATLRKYLMPPIAQFTKSRQKRQHDA
jgi:taurine dioxygenase